MLGKIFLGLLAIIFTGYGLYCLVNPGVLSGAAGVAANTVTGTIELQAMYGGLQTALGVLCGLGAFRADFKRTAMTALLFVFAGLAVVRVSLAFMHGDFSAYTVGAMSFESFCAVFLLWYLALRKNT